MIIKVNKILWNSSIKGMTIFPFIFINKNYDFTEQDMNHEMIHIRQQLELLIIPFYILYFLEYIIRLGLSFNNDYAYRTISFEKECYKNEKNLNYLKEKKYYSFIKYIKNG